MLGFFIVGVIAVLIAFALGAASMLIGFRTAIFKEKGYYPPPDNILDIKLPGKPSKKDEKPDKEPESPWDKEV